MSEDPNLWQPATKLVRGGITRSQFGEMSETLYLTQGFVYESAKAADDRFSGEKPGHVYSRYSNPTTAMFEERLALLEGAERCRAVASGMAAVHVALTGLVRAGDHVVAGRALFGSSRWLIKEWLPRFGVETTVVDGWETEHWEKAIRPNTKAVLIETPGGPLLEMTDIAAVCALAHQASAKVIVDNVFSTPVFQRPLQLGADLVVYSATKHIDGQGRVLAGAILGGAELMEESFRDILRHTGPAVSPFNSWVLLKGIETMDLRVRAQTASAARLADLIADHAHVARCYYPGRADHPQATIAHKQMSGFSNMIGLDLGSREAAWRFLDALQIVDISNNLGDAKSMATHPSSTTHRATPEAERLACGITEGIVRLNVGLEDLADLTRDISRALDAA